MRGRADAVSKPLLFVEEAGGDGGRDGRGGGGGEAAAGWASLPTETAVPSMFQRKKQTRGLPVGAGANGGDSAGSEAAWSFVELGGVFNDEPAVSKSRSDRTGEGNAACCNVCVAQQSVPRSYADVVTHPDQMAKTGACICGCVG
jgi:hypothetical protein